MAKQRQEDDRGATIPKLALTRAECAEAMGVGIRKVDELIAGRRGNGFPVVYVGTKPIMPTHDLITWLTEQSQGSGAQMNSVPMTVLRIRAYVSKFESAASVPCGVPMLLYLLTLIETDSDDRVQALLHELLETEKQNKDREIEFGDWVFGEIERIRQQERHRAARICELTTNVHVARELILDPEMHVQGGAA